MSSTEGTPDTQKGPLTNDRTNDLVHESYQRRNITRESFTCDLFIYLKYFLYLRWFSLRNIKGSILDVFYVNRCG